MDADLLYQIALSLVPNIGCVHGKILTDHFGTAEAIFKARKSTLEKLAGIGTFRAEAIRSFNDFARAEQEIAFIGKYKITPLFLNHDRYPKRLLQCYDSPTILYYRGDADLNNSRIVAVIGTRTNTDYGKSVTEKLVKDMGEAKILVLSGLAFGIDTIAHKASLKNNMPTVGVLAHGLDSIYPPENLRLARQMIAEGGGILTEFRSGTKPDKHHFPTRNRIVAGMADATVVVETDSRGGSMITAELANNYNRDVFAFPGKTTDVKSRGCNDLVRMNKAALISSGKDLLEIMGWLPHPAKKRKVQRELFIELSPPAKILYDILAGQESVHIDQIYQQSQLSASVVAASLLHLELEGIVNGLPGKMYQLV